MLYAAVIGAGSSLLTVGYLTLYNWGVTFFKQPSTSSMFKIDGISFWPLILLTIAGVFIGVAIKFFGQHAGLGVAQSQYAKTGRIIPRYLPSILLEAFIALWSGASVGPEGPLVFLSGGFGTFVADRLKIEKDDVPLLAYSAIAGAFGGFFGSPVVGALGAYEYMYIKELNFYRHVLPGLIAAAVGYSIYVALLHTSFLGIFSFPNYASPHLYDLGSAVLVGVIAGVIGILFKVVFGVMHLVFARLNKRPVIRAIVGGVVIGLIGSFLPLTLYSGQNQVTHIIHTAQANPAAYTTLFLLLLVAVKVLLTTSSSCLGFRRWSRLPVTLYGRHDGSGDFPGLDVHSTGCGGDCGYGWCHMCYHAHSVDSGPAARANGRATRPIAGDYHWGCDRPSGIKGAHAPAAEAEARTVGRHW